MNRTDIALAHMASARNYLHTLIDGLEDDQYFWQPESGVTHIAWQLGHLAMAQYGLALFRQRGRESSDSEIMPRPFRKLFMKGTTPEADRARYPAPAEIRAVLDRVWQRVQQEVPTFSDEQLDEPVDQPWSTSPTKFGALLFAGDHEMLHAGQIGLLRRLMNLPPVR